MPTEVATPQTTHVLTKVLRMGITVIIDSSLTHYFLCDKRAKSFRLTTEPVPALKVMVANGKKL